MRRFKVRVLFKKYWSDLYPGMIDYYPMMPLRILTLQQIP